ncbi:malate synthase G [Aliiglaciecola litoralis]|uniref:Malate synthase G n=1 Tax=Aliiglaciecola litoralis TaxID=582857 RepID=A0ABN1LMG8_9ALTE
MQNYKTIGNLKVAEQLADFIDKEVIPGIDISADEFWRGFESILEDCSPANKALLEKRQALQSLIDDHNKEFPNQSIEQYKSFLTEIGYLLPDPAPFNVTTEGVDPEVATVAGPQLVVPINNARYAINAANARWGSLYDAAYGTDVISEDDGAHRKGPYNPVRGNKVISFARQWLDTIAPLANGSHQQAAAYQLSDDTLTVKLLDGKFTELQNQQQLIGYSGDKDKPDSILIGHHGLHVELQFDPEHPIGRTDPTGMKDILVESALSTIMDCEDSVAAVDAEDKTLVYRNWLGLMKGTLDTQVQKGQRTITRRLNPDRRFKNLQGVEFSIKGRSLMFIRNVGLLMDTDAILYQQKPIPEGIMDAVITSLIAKHDLNGNSPFKNSEYGSIYIVKPKMHGPEEVAFSNTLFTKVEALLKLNENTIKMGIMDEERRTSVNLSACIAAAKHRVAFINTGFLDRTGDEIHTSMHLGPFALKSDLKAMPWIGAYEKDNVTRGLMAGLSGKAQIGKGMWPVPDNMADMMQTKIQHPQAGANTAWVPSPTAATLHALHYHQVDVFECQRNLSDEQTTHVNEILTVPLMTNRDALDAQSIQQEIDNNVQGILGYVVRWVNQGIGCSKVPDIHNVGLMEDRATLRISSQHIANWLLHGIVTEQQVMSSLERMAQLVDEQNQGDADYIPMCPELSKSIAFDAAKALIFQGTTQPSGYTEPLLHAMRRKMKAQPNQQ